MFVRFCNNMRNVLSFWWQSLWELEYDVFLRAMALAMLLIWF